MFKSEFFALRNACLLVCSALLCSTAILAQQVRGSIDPPKSIVSLAPTPRPQGERVARHPGDATFEHALANYHVFGAADVGTDAGVEALTLNFAADTRLTQIESKNKDFVVEPGGTCREGSAFTKGGSCSLLVRFNPQGPGRRLGFLKVTVSGEATPMTLGLVGNGYSPVISFTPAVITTVPGTFSAGVGTIKSATNMAVDGGDIVYVADTGNNRIDEIDSTGVINNTVLGPIATPVSLAVDSLGIIYTANTPSSEYYFSAFYPWGSQTAYGYAYASGTCTPSAPCPFATVGMSKPANMSIDNYDDLIFEEGTKGAAEMPVASISGGSGSFNLWYLTDQFSYSSGSAASFAVDASGNLYNVYNFGSTTCFLVEESLYSAEYAPTANRVAGGVKCGFSGDGGQARGAEISTTIGQIAFDVAGNLYFADAGNQRIRRIDASTGIINTIAGNGVAGYAGNGGKGTAAQISSPTGVAVDSSGQVYFLSTANTNQAIRKLTTQGIVTFLPQLEGTTSPSSATSVVTVSNTGNSELVLSNYAFTGTDPGDFSIDPLMTSCILTSGATLEAGQSCKIGFLFKPAGTGTRSANLLLNDNTVTDANTIVLTGTGVKIAPSPSSLTFGSEAVGSSTATKQVTLTNPGSSTLSISSIAITGTDASSFVLNYTCGSTLAAGASCLMNVAFHPATTGALTAEITITDNGGNSPQTVTLSGTGTTASVKPAAIQIRSSANPAATCNPVILVAQVTAENGEIPTGKVEFSDGTRLLGSALVENGEARFRFSPVNAETMMLKGEYSGDATHSTATSSVLKQVVVAKAQGRVSCNLRIF